MFARSPHSMSWGRKASCVLVVATSCKTGDALLHATAVSLFMAVIVGTFLMVSRGESKHSTLCLLKLSRLMLVRSNATVDVMHVRKPTAGRSAQLATLVKFA